MGVFSGWQTGGRTLSAADILALLVGRDVVAKSFTSSQASGSDAFAATTAGARFHFGPGTLDYITSDGAITLTTAGSLTVTGDLLVNTNSDALFSRNVRFNNNLTRNGTLLVSSTAPTIVAGAGASVIASNGSAAFQVDLGAAASTGTITLPAATTGWVITGFNITNPAANVIGQTGFTQTTATFTNYIRTTGVAGNWTAGDDAVFIAIPF